VRELSPDFSIAVSGELEKKSGIAANRMSDPFPAEYSSDGPE